MSSGERDIETTSDVEIREKISHWLVQVSSGGVSEAETQEFQAWLAADPAHEQAYAQAARLWSAMEGEVALEELMPAPGRRETVSSLFTGWRLAPLAGAAAACAIVVSFVLYMTAADDPHIQEDIVATAIAEIRDVMLDDGSVVTLGADSRLTVDFTDAERRVVLSAGEAFFSVQPDKNRPFFVIAGETRLRVVGTKFDVRHGARYVQVTVLEGVVEVEPVRTTVVEVAPVSAEKRTLTAGQQILSTEQGKAVVRNTAMQKIALWRTGRLEYASEALREVVSDANRYYDGEIVLGSEALGDLRVTASFRAGQIEQMISGLASALELEADRSVPGRIVLSRRRDPV